MKTITYPDLVKKYDKKFDTLVLDCEGAFYHILQDYPEILENINLIIMENDYKDINQYQYVSTQLRTRGFSVAMSKALNIDWETACKDFFFEVWKRA
ncbi:hypothetical protein EBZ80_05475 [bacterium]|nr:hypothetical protein [bacterium]